MRGAKEEGMDAEPFFPRLHVKDMEKGGPRAPPRNKMALYEKFSIPSQRFNSSVGTPVAVPPHQSSGLVTGTSSSKCNQQPRDGFTSSDMPGHPSIPPAKRVCVQSSDVTILTSSRMDSSRRKASNDLSHGSCSAGNGQRTSDYSNANRQQHKSIDNEDDFMVPTFIESGAASILNDHLAPVGSVTLTASSATQKNSCSASRTSSDRQFREYTDNVRLNNREQNPAEQRVRAASINQDPKRTPDSRKKIPEPVTLPKTTSDQGDAGNQTATSSGCKNAKVCQEYCTGGINGANSIISIDVIFKGDISTRKSRHYEAQVSDSRADPIRQGNSNQESEHKADELTEDGNAYNNEAPEASLPESMPGMVTCPDDVVGLIGAKHFWKARRAIVDQQRIFSIQVFELHRLIKVQKLLAASSDVKIDFYLSPSPQKVPTKDMPSENSEKSCSPSGGQETTSQRANESVECPQANTIQDPQQIPGSVPSPLRSALDNRANPWCFHPQQNQWLVPVMSPSEGLIYKPYNGAFPPAAGFMAPFYGSYAPLSFPQIPLSHMNSPCNTIPYHQQAPVFFPAPYGLPMARPALPSTATEQVMPMVGMHPNSCYLQQSARSEVVSGPGLTTQTLIDNHVQGNALASPDEDAQGEGKDASPLLPISQDSYSTNPRLRCSDEGDRSRVIRVVPHTPCLATESAARIFRSIQEERQQYDV